MSKVEWNWEKVGVIVMLAGLLIGGTSAMAVSQSQIQANTRKLKDVELRQRQDHDILLRIDENVKRIMEGQ